MASAADDWREVERRLIRQVDALAKMQGAIDRVMDELIATYPDQKLDLMQAFLVVRGAIRNENKRVTDQLELAENIRQHASTLG